MFEIEISSHASRDIKKIKYSNPALFLTISKHIDSLFNNPYAGKSLKGNKKGCYSLGIGDYRIIYQIYSIQKVILIVRVGHRKDIYR